jgi:hypothetical protein
MVAIPFQNGLSQAATAYSRLIEPVAIPIHALLTAQPRQEYV